MTDLVAVMNERNSKGQQVRNMMVDRETNSDLPHISSWIQTSWNVEQTSKIFGLAICTSAVIGVGYLCWKRSYHFYYLYSVNLINKQPIDAVIDGTENTETSQWRRWKEINSKQNWKWQLIFIFAVIYKRVEYDETCGWNTVKKKEMKRDFKQSSPTRGHIPQLVLQGPLQQVHHQLFSRQFGKHKNRLVSAPSLSTRKIDYNFAVNEVVSRKKYLFRIFFHAVGAGNAQHFSSFIKLDFVKRFFHAGSYFITNSIH